MLSLHHGGVWLHHVNAFVSGCVPNFVQACESGSKELGRVSLLLLLSFLFGPCYVIPNLLGSDLLFFTSPHPTNPPASVAVSRNGWYFRGELLFPFLASIFISMCVQGASIGVKPEWINHTSCRPFAVAMFLLTVYRSFLLLIAVFLFTQLLISGVTTWRYQAPEHSHSHCFGNYYVFRENTELCEYTTTTVGRWYLGIAVWLNSTLSPVSWGFLIY